MKKMNEFWAKRRKTRRMNVKEKKNWKKKTTEKAIKNEMYRNE